MTKLIVDVTTGKETQRELNKAEKDQQKIDESLLQAAQAEAEATATFKAQLLAKLGITAEEAKLLLS